MSMTPNVDRALQEHTSQDELSLQQAQDSGLAPLASGEYGSRKNAGAQEKTEDGVAQMVGCRVLAICANLRVPRKPALL